MTATTVSSFITSLPMSKRHERVYDTVKRVINFSPVSCLLLLGFVAL
ncbi:MAG: hypothetical protein H6765_09080 [Candidatus Peribacteria bacterium]|nr:MAG: hypothetical protein H6765_09080 [Candidatus Peribacteria bacterium]